MTTNDRQYYTTAEVARIWRLNSRTVERWCRWGRIEAFQLSGPRGPWRIPHSAISQIGGTHGQQTIATTNRG